MCIVNPKEITKISRQQLIIQQNQCCGIIFKKSTVIREDREREQRTNRTQRRQQDHRYKPSHFNNHVKCKWSKTHLKSESVRSDEKKIKAQACLAYWKPTLNIKTQIS